MSNETIFLNQFNTADLSHLSYYLESDKEAIVVDPVTDIQPYIQLLQANKAKLKYILNTHINTDYVTGSYDLAIRTGATMVFGPNCSFKVNNRLVSKKELNKKLVVNNELFNENNLNETEIQGVSDLNMTRNDQIVITNTNTNDKFNSHTPGKENNNKQENKVYLMTEEVTYNDTLAEYLDMFNLKVNFLNHNENFKLGKLTIQLIHTPGHTIESSCYLILDGNGKANCVFTGDTLLIGDIGRPDMSLVSERPDYVLQKDLAKMLYNSLSLIRSILPEDLTIYPTHSYGSPVGRTILNGQSTTLKQELVHNKLFKEMSIEDFISNLSNESYRVPDYFHHIAKINLNYFTGKNFDFKMNNFYKPVEVEDLITKIFSKDEKSVVILDTRFPFTDLEEGYIPYSYIISLKAPFSIWTGYLLNPSDPIVVVTSEGKERESIARLLRTGFLNIIGYLNGGFKAYKEQYEAVCNKYGYYYDQLKPWSFDYIKEKEGVNYVYNSEQAVLDVREDLEHPKEGYFPNSLSIPLTTLCKKVNHLSREKYKKCLNILCRTGIRSAMAYSILKQEGFKNLRVIEGGLGKIKEKGVKLVE
jgi:hydroxyacylglutathione hydrolase